MKKPPVKPPKKTASHKHTKKDFLVVGLGGSAGGVKALQEFFATMPPNSGMAFVAILHLSPEHESNLPDILQARTSMPVIQVTKTVKVEPNNVYVIPPNQQLEMVDGVIRPAKAERPLGHRVAVDVFFRTLAEAYERNAVCIVLSGTGSDGTLGLKRVKESNGFAIVQDPEDAEYDSMPRSAINTQLADWVLPVHQMPEKLIGFKESSERLHLTNGADAGQIAKEINADESLREILTLLRVRTGHDFSNYKTPTLIRRIARHLQIHELEDIPAYLELLRQKPDEIQSLLKNLLINVTNFFRDKAAFDALETEVIPRLFDGKTSKDSVRVWSAGCASGEEAYSLAMLLTEYTDRLSDPPKFQVFASDVDDEAIAEAREHRYAESIEADIPPERLKRFFYKEGSYYRVKKELRETVLFASHNILRDPPFSRLDLVACRNLLIYLNRETQERVLQIFHFALNKQGFLFLGSSETAENSTTIFAPVDKKFRLYSRRNAPAAPTVLPMMPVAGRWEVKIPGKKITARERAATLSDIHYRLLESYAPSSVLVNQDFDIVYLSGAANKFLRFASGEPSRNLLKAVLPDLLPDLRAALFIAQREHKPSEFPNVRIKIDGDEMLVNLIVRSFGTADDEMRDYLLVVFEERVSPSILKQADEDIIKIADKDGAMETVIRRLEEDLQRTKEHLRTTIEQHETSVEELKASNEELQAINEELRSASEELETSKEELQSVNEELTTVNHELKEKIDETSRINSDLQNLMAATDIATIFLDKNLRIKRYTPPVQDIFNITPTDIGRPLEHFTHKLNYAKLATDAAEVLRTLKSIETEIFGENGNVFLARFVPYRTIDDRIDGVVLNFIDIAERRRAEKARHESEEQKRLIIESAKDYAIFTLDLERRIISWNAGAEALTGYTDREILGKSGDIIFTPEDRKQGAPEREAETALTEGVAVNERFHQHKDGSRFWGSGLTRPLRDEAGGVIGFVKVMRDLTEQKRAQEAKLFLASIVESSDDSIITINLDGIITSWNKGAEWLYGYPANEVIGKPMTLLTLPRDLKQVLDNIERIRHSRKVETYETVRTRKDGSRINLEIVLSPVKDDKGNVIGASTIARDITTRKRTEANLAFLAQTSADFAPLLSVEQLLELVGNRLGDFLNLSRCNFSVIDEKADRIECLYDWRGDKSLPSIVGSHRISDYLTETGRRYYAAGKLAVIDDTRNNPMIKASAETLGALGIGSLVDAPYIVDGVWKFLLTVVCDKPHEWRKDEVELIRELAERVYIRVERARAEEALRESEDKYRTLFESVDEGFTIMELVFDDSGNIADMIYREANTAFEKHAGIKNIVGRRASEFFPHLEQHWLDTMLRVHQTGVPERAEGYNADMRRWITTQYTSVGGAGSPFIAAVFNDITERKRTEANLAFLADVSERLIDLSNVSEIVQVFGAKVSEFFGASICVFIEIDAAKNEAFVFDEYYQGVGQSLIGRYDLTEYITEEFQRTMKSGKAVIVRDVANDSRIRDKGKFAALDIGSLINAPLIRDGEWRFTLGIYREEPYDWRNDEIELILECAARIWNKLERARAEEAVRESEELFRLVSDALPSVIYDWNVPEDKITRSNELENLLGFSPDDPKTQTNKWWQSRLHPDDAKAAAAKVVERLKSNEYRFEDEYRVKHRDGHYVWVRDTGVLLRDENGRVVRWIGSAANITKRKETEEHFRAIVNQNLAGIFEVDLSGKIIFANDEFCRMLGYDCGTLAELQMEKYIHSEDLLPSLKKLERMQKDKKPFEMEKRYLKKDGSVIWVHNSISPISNGDHKIHSAVVVSLDITERKNAENALRESEERMRMFINASSDTIYKMSADWKVMYSLEGMEFLADTRNPNQSWLEEYIPESDKKMVQASINDAIRQKKTFELEHRVIRADGTDGWTFSRAIPLLDDKGKIISWFGAATDITTRKNAEQALKDSEERLRIAIEAAEMATWDWNLETGEIIWNERHFTLFAMKPSGKTQHPDSFYNHVHPEDREWVSQRLAQSIETNTNFEAEFRVVRDDGKLRWMEGYGHIVEMKDGNPVRMSGVMSDITERKRAEEAVRRSEERLQLIMKSITDYAIITTDEHCVINGWNTGAENTFGYRAEEALGQACDIIFTPEDRKAGVPQQEVETALRQGYAEDERWHIRKDGSRFFASGVLTPIRDGEIEGFVKIASDQTARLEAERDLNEKEMLRRLIVGQEDERRRIARDIHDHFGQQMTALRMKIDAVKQVCQTHPMPDKNAARNIEEAQQIAAQLDADVDFIAWELRPAALDDLGLRLTLQNFVREWAHHTKIKSEFHSSGLMRLRLNFEIETNLYRIAQEALNNIYKHAKAKNVSIILERRTDTISLIIEDDGTGFNLADKKIRRKGIGLTGMQERARILGGDIEIESEKGKGTTVFARVPAKYAE